MAQDAMNQTHAHIILYYGKHELSACVGQSAASPAVPGMENGQ